MVGSPSDDHSLESWSTTVGSSSIPLKRPKDKPARAFPMLPPRQRLPSGRALMARLEDEATANESESGRGRPRVHFSTSTPVAAAAVTAAQSSNKGNRTTSSKPFFGGGDHNGRQGSGMSTAYSAATNATAHPVGRSKMMLRLERLMETRRELADSMQRVNNIAGNMDKPLWSPIP